MKFQDFWVALKAMCSTIGVILKTVGTVVLGITFVVVIGCLFALLITTFPIVSLSLLVITILGLWFFVELQSARATREYEELVELNNKRGTKNDN